MKVAALQFAPRRAEPEHNLERMDALTHTIEADLLVMPELAHSGYFFTSAQELRNLAENPENGRFCVWIRDLAAAKDMVVVAGFAELASDGRLFNSALIALPDRTWSVYRKTHLFYKEHLVFAPGDSGFTIVEWQGVRIGTMVCYDWRFPEASRTLALRGADIIAHPSDLVAAKHLWGPTMRTRALENKVVIVTANRCGDEVHEGEHLRFSGESQITAMNGKIIAEAGPDDESVIFADVDPIATRDKSFNSFNDIIRDRRPDLYL
ncbi:MAG: carbon-nitrogen hydrolase [bacterium]|nr:carbon-nitrogen hydrolase [Candidatus Kapabacteria bacterium]